MWTEWETNDQQGQPEIIDQQKADREADYSKKEKEQAITSQELIVKKKQARGLTNV